MTAEPSRLIAAITAALTATVGLLTIVGVWDEKIGGAVTAVLAAWILVAGEIVRSRVTPIQSPDVGPQ